MAKLIQFDDPLTFYLFFISDFIIVKYLTWYYFLIKTRKSYNLAIELFEYFYMLWQKLIWLILVIILEEKISMVTYFLSQTKCNQR